MGGKLLDIIINTRLWYSILCTLVSDESAMFVLSSADCEVLAGEGEVWLPGLALSPAT